MKAKWLLVALLVPRSYFFFESVSIGNSSLQALANENTELAFGHVEPAPMLGSIVKFQLVRDPLRFSRLERLIQGSLAMGVQIV